MQNFTDFIIFKTDQCQETLCTCYRGGHDNDELPNDYAECPYYHNNTDKRREPYEDLSTFELAYQHVRPDFENPDPEGCLNEIEYMYHPLSFKVFQCKSCPGFFCPFFHTEQEKLKWDKILKRGQAAGDRNIPPALNQNFRNDRPVNGERNSSQDSDNLREDGHVYIEDNDYIYHQDPRIFKKANLDIDLEIVSVKEDNPRDNALLQDNGSQDSVTEQTAEEFKYNLSQGDPHAQLNIDPQSILDQRNEYNWYNTTEQAGEAFKNANSNTYTGNSHITEAYENGKTDADHNEPRHDYNREVFANLGKKRRAVEIRKDFKAPNQNTVQMDPLEEVITHEQHNPQQIDLNNQYNVHQREASIKRAVEIRKDITVPIQNKPQVNDLDKMLTHEQHIPQRIEMNNQYNIHQVEASIKRQIGVQSQLRGNLWPKNNIPFSYGITPYAYGELIDVNEDRKNEFKAFKGHQYFDDLIEKYVCSFLNSKGGTIYLGVVDDGRAFGIKMDRKLLDELSISFDRKLKSFYPPVRADQYNIVACPVYDGQAHRIVKDHYVIEIHIQQGDPYELYFNDKKCCYARKQASSIFLQPEEIKAELRARTKSQMAKNLLGLVADKGFEDGLKRQTSEDLRNFRREFEDKIKLIDELLRSGQERQKYDELVQKLGFDLNI